MAIFDCAAEMMRVGCGLLHGKPCPRHAGSIASAGPTASAAIFLNLKAGENALAFLGTRWKISPIGLMDANQNSIFPATLKRLASSNSLILSSTATIMDSSLITL